MKIRRFNPEGIQPTEVVGVREAEANLPEKWFGFANLLMRMPDPTKQAREIDLFIVSEDRIFLVDFKHWHGRVESRGGIWYQNGERRGISAAAKISENAKKLHTLLERDVPALRGVSPYVEACVVFTNSNVDLNALSPSDRPHIWKLSEFIKTLRNKDLYFKRFRRSDTWNELRPLYDPERKKALESFFCDPDHFEPRDVLFRGYKPGAEPVYIHPRKIYSEYFCELLENPDYTALLRYWDFEAVSPDMSVSQNRREVAERERAVVGYLNRVDPELYDEGVLKPDYWDDQFSLRYWELLQIRRSMRRVADYIQRRAPDISRRLDLVSLLLGRVASLHRLDVAHRDLAPHSVWFDEQRSRVMLSAFMSAFFNERTTVGALRHRITVAARVPEELEAAQRGDPFKQDVFLLGVLVWKILTGRDIERTEENVPIWFSDEFAKAPDLPALLEPWFECALSMDPAERFQNAVDMYDGFTAAVRRPDEAVSVQERLSPYRREAAPYLSFPPVRKLKAGRSNIWTSDKEGATVLVKLWPVSHYRITATICD